MIYRHKWKNHVSVYNHTDRGFCKLTIFRDGYLKAACLHDLVVYTKKRGQGFGRELLAWAIGRATVEGCDVLFLWAEGEPWVEEWYKRHGFNTWASRESESGASALALWINK